MGRIYKTYAEIKIKHNYYANQVCSDLDIVPTMETRSILSKYRLHWAPVNRVAPSGYQLLREHIDDANPLLPLPGAYQLRFGITLRNDAFSNFTLGAARTSREIFFFENQPDNVSLMGASLRKMELVAAMAVVSNLPASNEVTVTPESGGASWVVAGVMENGVRVARIDLSKKPIGIYNLTWTGGSKSVYNDSSLMGQGLFGILHLTVKPGLNINSLLYVLTFLPKTARWKYFVILKKSPHTGSTYAIFNRNAAGNGAFTFGNYLPVNWDPVLDPNYQQLLDMNPGATIKAYISNVAIPYRDATRSSIKLERSGSFARVVVNDLPNPPVGAANPAVILAVDNPTP